MTDALRVSVECYAGHRGEETPRRFRVGDRWITVAEVLDRSQSPDHRYLRVRDEQDGRYLLRHDPAADEWELAMERKRPTG